MRSSSLRAAAALAAAAGLASFSSAAMAQAGPSVSNSVLKLQTTVPAFCQATIFPGTPSLNVGDLTDQAGFLVSTFGGTTSIQTTGNYYCNAPARVTLSAAPLQVTPSVAVSQPDSFTNRVDFKATLTWAGTTTATTESNASAAATVDTTQPTTGPLKVVISDPRVDGTKRPIAGSYLGAVTVTVAVS